MTDELTVRSDGAVMFSMRLDAEILKRLDRVVSARQEVTALGVRRITRSEIARLALLDGLTRLEQAPRS